MADERGGLAEPDSQETGEILQERIRSMRPPTRRAQKTVAEGRSF